MSVEDVTKPVDYSENHDAELLTTGILFVFLAFLSVVARVYSKRVRHLPLQSDDFLLFGAFALTLVETLIMIKALSFANLGRHSNPESLAHNLVGLGKCIYIAGLLQPIILYLSKLSVLILLYRVFITRASRITLHILAFITTAWFIATFFADMLICLPISSQWSDGACEAKRSPLDQATPIPWIVTDFAILVAPIPMVRRLRLPTPQKVEVIGLFLIGTATCVVSVIRYTTLFYNLQDVTYDMGAIAVWNMLEADITVMCAALVAAKPAFMLLVPKRLLDSGRRWYSGSVRASGSKSGNTPAQVNGPRPVEDRAQRNWEDGGEFARLPSGLSADSIPMQLQEVDMGRDKSFDCIREVP